MQMVYNILMLNAKIIIIIGMAIVNNCDVLSDS